MSKFAEYPIERQQGGQCLDACMDVRERGANGTRESDTQAMQSEGNYIQCYPKAFEWASG